MKKIVLHHHTGLGDHFICNGLVHAFANTFDEVNLVCKRHYVKTVSHLYEDFADKIKILPVDEEFNDSIRYSMDNKMELYRVGFDKVDFENFEDSFYTQYNLDPMLEYYGFVLPKNLETSKLFYQKLLKSLGEEYIIVHDVSSYKIFDLKIETELPRHTVDKSDTDDVLDYVDAICNAKEVHVINSGLNNLVFQLFIKKMTKGKIYFHAARKVEDGGIPVKIPEGIEVVDYE